MLILARHTIPQEPEDGEFFFETVFDYGEHHLTSPRPDEVADWQYRLDAFSSYRSGFEIRTNRLCRRILLFYHFDGELQFDGSDFGNNYLVKSLDLVHEPSSINNSGQAETTYLSSITQYGYIRKPDNSYSKKSLPPVEFTYETLNWDKTIKVITPKSIVNAPVGLTNNHRWVDLYGEGISGILAEQGEGWFYKSNLGTPKEDGNVVFAEAREVLPKPSFLGLGNGTLSVQDLAANGQKQIVVNSTAAKGYFEIEKEENWKSFQPFTEVVNIDLQDPNIRLLDLNGDGQPDLVITEENAFTWYAANGKEGYGPSQRSLKPWDENQGPAVVFADQQQTIFLADMAGDGLTDIVRIRNGEVCYWANRGYGKFSAKINMGNAPLFDHPDLFNPKYLHLADVSGTGATDILYLGKNTFKAFINLSGNSWSAAHEIEPFFPIDSQSQLSVVDLLGTGTSCIVWSSPLPSNTSAPMKYIDLMGSKKPHVLTHYKNNMGMETTLEYKSSTYYYLKDKAEGKPWITKLPFPVQVVSRQIVEEKVTDVRFSSSLTYHHGYYDHKEREFRGFGRVDQLDSEYYADWRRDIATNQLERSEALFQKPVLTKTWFHTGAYLERDTVLNQFAKEYWFELYNESFPDAPISINEPDIPDAHLSDTVLDLSGAELCEAFRACKGMMLRQEVFALEGSPEEQFTPYTVATHNCNIQLIQPKENNKHCVFIVSESEAIAIHYERNINDPRIAHTLNTRINELGHVLESVSIVYGRKPEQASNSALALSTNVTDFSQDVLNDDEDHKRQLQTNFFFPPSKSGRSPD